MSAPCKHCENRYIGCHSKCEKYIQYKKEMAEVDKKRKFDSDYADFVKTNTLKRKKGVKKAAALKR